MQSNKGKSKIPETSRNENSSMSSNLNVNRGKDHQIGRSQNIRYTENEGQRGGDLNHSTIESGPEIMYIEPDENDRRNPMIDYTAGRVSSNRNLDESRSTGNIPSNERKSILTSLRNDIATEKDYNLVKNSPVPSGYDLNREKSPVSDEPYLFGTKSINMKKMTKTPDESSFSKDEINYKTETGRKAGQGIGKKMSPNRNEDIEVDTRARRDTNLKVMKRMSNYAVQASLQQPKPEFSEETRNNIQQNYSKDLDKIMKSKLQTDTFRRTNSKIVSYCPKEGRLINNEYKVLNPILQEALEDRKDVIKKMNKLSNILMANKTEKKEYSTNTGRPGSSDFSERSYRKTTQGSPKNKLIRVTMGVLSSKGPNCEDRIITRQMRFEKGGVVDLAQSSLKSSGSAGKLREIKKITNPRSPISSRHRYTFRDKEKAAKTVQGWWRGILTKYKDVIDKVIMIQKYWRRFAVRNNLYVKLYIFYLLALFVNKIQNVMTSHDKNLQREFICNLDRKRYFALKYLKSILTVQRCWRFYKNIKKSYKRPVKEGKIIIKKKPIPGVFPEDKNIKTNIYKPVRVGKKPVTDEVPHDEEEDQNIVQDIKKPLHPGKKPSSEEIPQEEIVSSAPHRKLVEKFDGVKKALLSSTVRNILRNSLDSAKRSYLIRWIKLCGFGANSELTRKLAINDIVNPIKSNMKNKLDDFVFNLRKVANKPDKKKALNRLLNQVIKLFTNRSKQIYSILKSKGKATISSQFVSKLLGMHLLKTANKYKNRILAKRFKKWKSTKVVPNTSQIRKSLEGGVIGIKRIFWKRYYPLVKKETKGKDKLLMNLTKRLVLKYKLLNLPQFFHLWRGMSKLDIIDDLKLKILKKAINSVEKKSRLLKISKRFRKWSNFAKSNRTLDESQKMVNSGNRKLQAASKMGPALAKYLKNKTTKLIKPNLIEFLTKVQKRDGMKKILYLKPLYEKIQKRKYLYKFINSIEKSKTKELKDIILQKVLKKSITKNQKDVLKKKLNKWWRTLSQPSGVKNILAVARLRQVLQKRYCQLPINILQEKSKVNNYDYAKKFVFEIKDRIMKKHFKQYLLRWKNNADESRLQDKMKQFYVKLLAKYMKNIQKKLLLRKFNQYRRNAKEDIYERSDKLKTFITIIQGYLNSKTLPLKEHFIKRFDVKRRNRKYQIALNMLVDLSIHRELKKLGQYFRKWNKKALLKSMGVLRANLIARIFRSLFEKRDGLKKIEKLNVYFSRWVKAKDGINDKITNLRGLFENYINSEKFRNKSFRPGFEVIMTILKSIYTLKYGKADKIGNFIRGILGIYKRINIMKRTKVLHEALKKLNFVDRMKVRFTIGKWRNKTATRNNNEQATIIQKFFRDIAIFRNTKIAAATKAMASVDSFMKRFVIYKLSNTSKMSKFVNIFVKVLEKIPKELRRNYLMRYCIIWKDSAFYLKKKEAVEAIQKRFRAYIIRKFYYGVKLRKHKLNEILRRVIRSVIGEKRFFISKWRSLIKILDLKNASQAIGLFVFKKHHEVKRLRALMFLRDIFRKFVLKNLKDCMQKAGEINPNRTDILVSAVNRRVTREPYNKVIKQMKNKIFRKDHRDVLARLMYGLRIVSVNFYTKLWRDKCWNDYLAKLMKLQNWIRMKLIRRKARRDLEKNKILLRYILKIHFDEKFAKQGYVNLWRNIVKDWEIHENADILIKIIESINANHDYNKDVAKVNLKKIFRKYFINRLHDQIISAKIQKDNIIDALKSLDSKIEKRYTMNNLVDYGKDSIRRILLSFITGNADKLTELRKKRIVIEKWRLICSKIWQFAVIIQRRFRGFQARKLFQKNARLHEIFMRIGLEFLDPTQIKRVRMNMWRKRNQLFNHQEKATTIQNFFKEALDNHLKNKLHDLLENGYRRHFVRCIGQTSRFNKLKIALSRPQNIVSMGKIRQRFILLKIQDFLRNLMGKTEIANIDNYKKQLVKRWRINALKLKEEEMLGALLIVASIKGCRIRLMLKKFRYLSGKVQRLIYKALGGYDGLCKSAFYTWRNLVKKESVEKNSKTISEHAVEILKKIKRGRAEDNLKTYGKGLDRLHNTVSFNLQEYVMNLLRDLHKKKLLEVIGKTMETTKRNNKLYAFKQIKGYGDYRIELIKNIQKYWRQKIIFNNAFQRLRIIRSMIKMATNKDYYLKHAFTVRWRNHTRIINNQLYSNIIQNFFRQILEYTKITNKAALDNVQKLFRIGFIKLHLLKTFTDMKKLLALKSLDNLVVRKILNFFNQKSLLLYILNLIFGVYSRCENKVKHTVTYKFRRIALRLRDQEASNKILTTLKEVKNRRYDNKIRDILAKVALGQILSETDKKMRTYTIWCRNAHFMKLKETAGAIDGFLFKKKRSLDLKKKWMNWGIRLAGKNGVCSVKFLRECIFLYRKINPFVELVKKQNLKLNGRNMLKCLRFKSIMVLIRDTISSAVGIIDIERKKEIIKKWRNKIYKIQTRENTLANMNEMLRTKLHEDAFRTVVSAFDFKRFSKYARITLIFDALKRMRTKAASKDDINQFGQALVKSQDYLIESGSNLLKDKLYKFYVYKILANMANIFLNHRSKVYMRPFLRKFWGNINLKATQGSVYSYTDKVKQTGKIPKYVSSTIAVTQVSQENKQLEFIENKLKPINYITYFVSMMERMDEEKDKKRIKQYNLIKAMSKISKLFTSKNGETFNKIKDLALHSSTKANLFLLLRKAYIQEKLNKIEESNHLLMLNFLATKSLIYKNSLQNRRLLKFIRDWKFKAFMVNMRETKIQSLDEQIKDFGDKLKQDLFNGPSSINKLFKNHIGVTLELPNPGMNKNLNKISESKVKKEQTIHRKDTRNSVRESIRNPNPKNFDQINMDNLAKKKEIKNSKNK